jgi:hypothetical protein
MLEWQMSIFSSDGEVFGARVLYGAMVALSVFTLLAAVASTTPRAPVAKSAAAAPQTVETIVVSAPAGNLS